MYREMSACLFLEVFAQNQRVSFRSHGFYPVFLIHLLATFIVSQPYSADSGLHYVHRSCIYILPLFSKQSRFGSFIFQYHQ